MSDDGSFHDAQSDNQHHESDPEWIEPVVIARKASVAEQHSGAVKGNRLSDASVAAESNKASVLFIDDDEGSGAGAVLESDVFLGFCENDHETASRIAAVLINKGLKVSPPRFTPTSAAYNNKVELQMDSIRSPADEEDALSTAAVFVPILSNGFEGSPQLREDLFYAHKEQRIIVPVLMVKDTRLTWSAILTCGLGSQGTSIREALYNTTVATASISREPIDLSNWVDGDDKLWNLAMDMLVERVTSLAQSVAGSPSSLRASKMPLESTTSSSSSIDSASPATSRPSSVIYSAQRKPRLSILRPRSSIWNLSQGNIASAPSSYNGLRKDKLRGFPLLKKYLRPTLICADEELDTLYAKLDPNTRGWLLNNVAKWMGEVDNPEEDAVLWILGENGTGKSVAAAALIKHLPALLPDTRIAWTVARRDVATDAGSLLNNLVYKLSESWSEYTKALLETERKKGPEVFNNICNATLPQRLRLLLSDPLLAAVSSTPEETSVLFVIEGLEHFEDEEGMLDFVMVLKEEMRVLPPNVKWLFISEATQEVHDALVHLNPAHIELEGVLQRKDLMKWHRSLITPILVPDWEGENEDLDEAVYALTSRSGNSFLYTRFALAPIHISGVRFRGPKFVTAALETFPLDVDSTLLGLLTYLHAEATPADISLFRAVFGTLMFLKAPLSIPALAAFIDQPTHEVRATLASCSPLLDHLGGARIQLAHTRIADFLVNPHACRDARFYLDARTAHVHFALRLLKHLLMSLRANPLQLEDPSTWLNEEVPALEESLAARVGGHVQYAALYLGVHLEPLRGVMEEVGGKVVTAFVDLVGVFVAEKMLEWMEALSLMGKLEEVARRTLRVLEAFVGGVTPRTRIAALGGFLKRGMGAVVRVASRQASSLILGSAAAAGADEAKEAKVPLIPSWIEGHLPSTAPPVLQTLTLIRDAVKLLAQFQEPIRASAFHVYISAIPFSPPSSLIHRMYRKRADRAAFSSQGTSRRVPIVMRGVEGGWPDLLHTIKSHTRLVSAVCVSPDGRWIVSASYDRTVRIFEAETGLLYRVLEGHTDQVWNISVSPDSTTVVSGGHDQSVKTWLIRTGECLKTSKAKTAGITKMTVTRDGQRMVSIRSSDCAVVVRDTERMDEVVWAFVGHQGAVQCVAVSADAAMVVSGGEDATVRLWDLVSGKGIRTLEGHAAAVQCVFVSPDGRFILSGSADETLRLWEVASGRCVQVLVGHDGCVNTAAITPDGTRAVSGSDDQTICIWDLRTDDSTTSSSIASAKPITTSMNLDTLVQRTCIEAIKITTTGRAVVSAGSDDLVHVWNAETGEYVRSFEYSLLGAASRREAVSKIARMPGATDPEAFEYVLPASGGIVADRALVQIPGGKRVGVDRIEIKKRGEGAVAIVKVDGRAMMLTAAEVERIEAQIRVVQEGGELVSPGVTSPVSDGFWDDEEVKSWYVSKNGWVFDQRENGVRRFWLPEKYRGEIVSHQGRIVAIASADGQVFIVHV